MSLDHLRSFGSFGSSLISITRACLRTCHTHALTHPRTIDADDLSDNMQYYECPTPSTCTLDEQVNFYMSQYAAGGIRASTGYEIGQPAYPSPIHDPTHQLPLTQSALALILANTQPSTAGAFFCTSRVARSCRRRRVDARMGREGRAGGR